MWLGYPWGCLVQSFCLAVAWEVCKISTIVFHGILLCLWPSPASVFFCMVYNRVTVALLQIIQYFLCWQRLAFSGCHSLIQHNILQYLGWLLAKDPACQSGEIRYMSALWNFPHWRFSRTIRKWKLRVPEVHEALPCCRRLGSDVSQVPALMLVLFYGKGTKLGLKKYWQNNSSERPETPVIEGSVS